MYKVQRLRLVNKIKQNRNYLGPTCKKQSPWLQRLASVATSPQRAPEACRPRSAPLSRRGKWAPARWRRPPRPPGAAPRTRTAACGPRAPPPCHPCRSAASRRPRPATALQPNRHACPNRRFPGAAGGARPRASARAAPRPRRALPLRPSPPPQRKPRPRGGGALQARDGRSSEQGRGGGCTRAAGWSGWSGPEADGSRV